MIERRHSTSDGVALAKTRTATGQASTISGYAARFDREAVIAGAFREVIARGAFAEALKTSDTRALVNHDSNQLIGRRKAGTLQLEEDAAGLFYRVQLPDTQVGRDVRTLIQRGDMSGSSFAFTVKEDRWTFPTRSGELPKRTILAVDDLVDISPVTFPAYSATSVQANSREARSRHEYAADTGKGGETVRAKAALEARMAATCCARCGGALPLEAVVIGTGARTFEAVCAMCAEAADLQARRRAQTAESPEQQYRRRLGRIDVAEKLLNSYR